MTKLLCRSKPFTKRNPSKEISNNLFWKMSDTCSYLSPEANSFHQRQFTVLELAEKKFDDELIFYIYYSFCYSPTVNVGQ